MQQIMNSLLSVSKLKTKKPLMEHAALRVGTQICTRTENRNVATETHEQIVPTNEYENIPNKQHGKLVTGHPDS